MDIKNFDLNLLKCFDAIHRHQNVSAAAEELELTQGGMSSALRRLRIAFNDPLFARSSIGMKSTPLADTIAPKIGSMLESVRDLDKPARFNPANTEINYKLYINDAGLMVLLPRIMRRLKQQAPGACLTIVDLRPDEVIKSIDKGQVDVAIGYFLNVPGWARQQKLKDSHYVCVVRADHPTIGDKITMEQYMTGEHVMYWNHDALYSTLEAGLARIPSRREVRLRIPRFSAIPSLIADSDYILTVPEDVGLITSQFAKVKLLKPPFAIDRFTVRQYWHERLNADSAHKWFRGVLKEEVDLLNDF